MIVILLLLKGQENQMSSRIKYNQSVRRHIQLLIFVRMRRKMTSVITTWLRMVMEQWIVDMYVKIESMRLDWYSNPEHQKIIKTDLYQV